MAKRKILCRMIVELWLDRLGIDIEERNLSVIDCDSETTRTKLAMDTWPELPEEPLIEHLRDLIRRGRDANLGGVKHSPQAGFSKHIGTTRKITVADPALDRNFVIGGFGYGWHDNKLLVFGKPVPNLGLGDLLKKNGLTQMGYTRIDPNGNILGGWSNPPLGGYSVRGLRKKLEGHMLAEEAFAGVAGISKLIDYGFIQVKNKSSGYLITQLPKHLTPTDLLDIDLHMRSNGHQSNLFNWYSYRKGFVLNQLREREFYYGGGHLGNSVISASIDFPDRQGIVFYDFDDSSRTSHKLRVEYEDALFTGSGLASLVDFNLSTQVLPMIIGNDYLLAQIVSEGFAYHLAGYEGNPNSDVIATFPKQYLSEFNRFRPENLEQITERTDALGELQRQEFLRRNGHKVLA